MASTIEHVACLVEPAEKAEWLARFLKRTHGTSLVFVRTKRGADKLARRLRIAAVAGAIALLTVGVNFVVDWFLHKTSGLRE